MTRAAREAPLKTETAVVSDARALAALVSDCGAQRLPLVDYGVAFGGLGHPPPARHIRLVQKATPGAAGSVFDHYQRDFAVRAPAGMTIADLQAALRPMRQFVPIDAEDDMTLGEIIAHNVYGPLRLSYGSMRDLLLGLCYIDGLGRDIHVGGRTVKNVAGYDLTRFMVGSLGEFGAIHEATVRTYALPEAALIVEMQIDNPSTIDRGMSAWLTTDAASTYHYLRWEADRWLIRIGYFGEVARCDKQLAALERGMEGAAHARIIATLRKDAQTDHAERAAHRAWRRPAAALVKAVVPPASTGAACEAIRAWAQSQQVPLRIEAVPSSGRILTGGDLTLDLALLFDQMLRALLVPLGGFRMWIRRPEDSERIDPFFPLPPEWPLLLRLKKTMDPLGILNPGRCVPAEGREPAR